MHAGVGALTEKPYVLLVKVLLINLHGGVLRLHRNIRVRAYVFKLRSRLESPQRAPFPLSDRMPHAHLHESADRPSSSHLQRRCASRGRGNNTPETRSRPVKKRSSRRLLWREMKTPGSLPNLRAGRLAGFAVLAPCQLRVSALTLALPSTAPLSASRAPPHASS